MLFYVEYRVFVKKQLTTSLRYVLPSQRRQNENANVEDFFDREVEIQTESYNALIALLMQQALD